MKVNKIRENLHSNLKLFFQIPVESRMVQKDLNTSVCGNEMDFFDSEGRYIKTACAVFTESSYSEACTPFGMEKIVIDSKRVKRDVLRFATDMFGSGRGSTLWVNGKKGLDGRWHTDSSVELSNFKFKSQNTSEEVKNLLFSTIDENCLVVNAQSFFKVRTWVCSSSLYSICEYVKTLAPQQLQPNLDICHKSTHVHSRFKYYKSLCLIKQSLIYSDAEDLCDSNGMKLYLRGDEMKSADESAVERLFVGLENAKFWSGENSPVVLNVNDESVEFYEDCKFWVFQRFNRVFSAKRDKCSRTLWTVCEYNKNF
jgi:hypothetical protein